MRKITLFLVWSIAILDQVESNIARFQIIWLLHIFDQKLFNQINSSLPIKTVHKNVKKVTAVQTVIANAKTAFNLANMPFILKKKSLKRPSWSAKSISEVGAVKWGQ